MANKDLFRPEGRGKMLPKANAQNKAGGKAYAMSDEHALAQLVSTGCFNDTFYVSAQEQLSRLLDLSNSVSPKFLAQAAVYARQNGFMKDSPALMCAVLSTKDMNLLRQIFHRVIDNGKMIRNFVQVIRSGVVGRKSLGSGPRNLVREWFNLQSDESLFRSTVGNNPSIADVIKLARPKPATKEREALHAYILGYDSSEKLLPRLVQQFEDFKRNHENLPDVPFQMLSSLDLTEEDWIQIATNAPWHMTRMNINTFMRHGVFKHKEMIEMISERLKDPELIRRSRVFPYQIMTAYKHAHVDTPLSIRNALQDALDIAISNIPQIEGNICVLTDVSASMRSPVSGYRAGGTSVVSCVDVAALISASILAANRNTRIIPFNGEAMKFVMNPRDSVVTNAEKLAKLCNGGTNCSAPLALLNKEAAKADLVIYVSDNESWVDGGHRKGRPSATATMEQWRILKERNPEASMVCIDIQPNNTTHAKERDDIINIGGFSDDVFNLLGAISNKDAGKDYWVNQIQEVQI